MQANCSVSSKIYRQKLQKLCTRELYLQHGRVKVFILLIFAIKHKKRAVIKQIMTQYVKTLWLGTYFVNTEL
jgi:hypothetical protein